MDAIRQQALQAHDIDLSVELALDVVRRGPCASSVDYTETGIGEEAMSILKRALAPALVAGIVAGAAFAGSGDYVTTREREEP